MRKKNGWGLTAMLVLSGIICFALIVAAVIYEKNFNDKILPTSPVPTPNSSKKESYSALEEKVVEASTSYVEKYYYNMPEGSKVSVSVKQLQVESMLDTLTDSKNKNCTGYVTFEKVGDNITYKPYIKCGSHYTTNGYNKEYDK